MASAPQTPAAQPGIYVDPFRSYNFKLEINGVTEAHFHECSNIGVKVHALKWRSGGASQVVHRLPGRVEYADITLRYGLTKSTDMWKWLLTAVNGTVERKNISICVLEQDGVTEALRWNLMQAWISEWRGTNLNALSHEVGIEEMVLVYETLKRD